MTSTVVRDDHNTLVKRRASAYVPAAGGGWRTSVPGFDVVGDGGVYSTVEDLAKWDANFYEPRVGDREALAMVHERGVLSSGDTLAYAGGLSHGTYRGLRTVAHGGAYGGYRTSLMRFPDQRFAVAVLCNSGTANTGQLSQRVADVYLGADMSRPEARPVAAAAPPGTSLSADQIARYAGVYWDEQSEARIAVVNSAGRLSLVGFGAPLELRHLDGARFEAPNTGIGLAFADRVVHLTIGDARPIAYERVSTGTVPTVAELEAFAGRYASEEAEATVDVRIRDGKLEVSGRRLRPIALEHVFGSTFAGGPSVVRFIRKDGAVTGLTISNGRSRGVTFERR
jgi:hypothetical protein